MKKSLSVLLFTLFAFSEYSISQNVFEVVCSAYSKGRALKNIHYTLHYNNKDVTNTTIKNGITMPIQAKTM